ncbi:MAG: alpha/beta hydrolase [Gammaproteobacteria bacterium]|nr:alpha/beta hydrolase [Gammaproteobacteria bacterium]
MNAMQAKFNLVITILTALISLTACQTTKIERLTGDTIGMVLMHGWGARTPYYLRKLAYDLKSAGILVKTPMMPWSKNRIFDRGYEESMEEIDDHVALLKKAGAIRIFVAGHSIGANAALGYAARRENIDGVILMAYGHVPDFNISGRMLAPSVARSRTMIGAGKGESSAMFTSTYDLVRGTANDILSWFDPDGPSTLWHNARLVQPITPILCIDGLYDRNQRCDHIYVLLPGKNSHSRFTTVEATHLETPNASFKEVIGWLRAL